MKEAIGGAYSLTLVLAFLVVVITLLAFSINYTKAFRLKNAVLDYLEDGQGCTAATMEKIENIRNSVGYGNNFTKKLSGDGDTYCNNGICISYTDETSEYGAKYCGNNDSCKVGYFSVTTFIYVNIPIAKQMLGIVQENGNLNIQGDTTTIRVINSGNTCEGWTPVS
jgi:hypothetical protein